MQQPSVQQTTHHGHDRTINNTSNQEPLGSTAIQPKVNNIIHCSKHLKVSSEAYPSLQGSEPLYEIIKQPNPSDTSVGQKKRILQPQVKSQIHQKLLKINFNAENHKQPINVRQFQMNDLKELKKLQDEWFPIRYTDDFYKKIIRKQCYCLIAETVIKMPQYNIEKQQTKQVEQKVMVGAAVFQLTDSEGYAYKSWSQTFVNLFRTPQDSIYIMTLGVIDEFRKKGVGKILVQSILTVANQWKSVKLVYLHVISYNKAAINFYKKIGFTNLQILQNFYHVGGKQFNGQTYGMFVNDGKNGSKWSLWLRKLFN